MLSKLIGSPLTTTNGLNTDHEVSGANLPVAIVKTKQEQFIWVLDFVQYSYNKAEPVGGLTVKDGDKVVFDIDLVQPAGTFTFYIPSSPGKDFSVTLKAGGTGVVGKLNIQTHAEFA